MLRFFQKLIPFLFLQAAIFAILVCLTRRAPDSFIASILDKHLRLTQSHHPRLILVGGSNVAFGFQSEMLESNLPCEPANLGIHAGLGLEFILADALNGIEKNDVVLLSLEYGLMKQRLPTRELWEALLLRPQTVIGMHWLPLADAGFGFFGHVCDRSLKVFTGESGSPTTGIYQRRSFNRFGDVAAHRLLAPVRPYIDGDPRDIKTLNIASEDLLPVLKKFVATCEARGAKVVIFFPPVSDQLFATFHTELDNYVARQRDLFGDRVLGRLEDIPFPQKEFYDTCYHLTGPGSAHRTRQVIERLKNSSIFPLDAMVSRR